MLINWFKDNWRTHEYQRHFKRQKSPRIQLKAVPQPKQDEGAGSQYGDLNGNGAYGLKSERGPDARKSPGGNWNHVKQEGGHKSPKTWGDNNMHESQDQSMRGGDQNWGMANRDGGGRDGGGRDDYRDRSNNQERGRGGGGSRACFKCNEEGHFARECPNADKFDDGGGRGRGRGRGGGGGGGGRECYKCH